MQLAFRVGERHYRAPTNVIAEVVQFFKFSQHEYDNNYCYICIKLQKYIAMLLVKSHAITQNLGSAPTVFAIIK